MTAGGQQIARPCLIGHSMTNTRSRHMTNPRLAALILIGAIGTASCLSGCASTHARAVPQREDQVLTREYVAEVIRYLYRWHADETMLSSVSQHADTQLW